MENHQKCGNCGRSLTENEQFCYFCEMDIEELRIKKKGEQNKNEH